MKYLILKNESKQSAKGNAYQMVTLKGEDGIHVEASTFDLAGKATNETIEGEIVVNGKYTNFKLAMPPRPSFMGSKGGASMTKAMDRKETSINSFQENKEVSIKLSGSMRDAVIIVTARGISDLIPSEIQSEILKWRNWLLANHGDITDVVDPTK